MKEKDMKELILTTIIVFGLSNTATAKAVVFGCNFTEYFSPDNKTAEKPNKAFEITFSYDTVTKEAFMTGKNGVSTVGAFTGTDGVTFYELLMSGTIQTTTIQFSDLSVVHSRHTMILDEIVPSQYYGKCTQE